LFEERQAPNDERAGRVPSAGSLEGLVKDPLVSVSDRSIFTTDIYAVATHLLHGIRDRWISHQLIEGNVRASFHRIVSLR
jgi:hypothetical protein